jgi:hypothetical protein
VIQRVGLRFSGKLTRIPAARIYQNPGSTPGFFCLVSKEKRAIVRRNSAPRSKSEKGDQIDRLKDLSR